MTTSNTSDVLIQVAFEESETDRKLIELIQNGHHADSRIKNYFIVNFMAFFVWIGATKYFGIIWLDGALLVLGIVIPFNYFYYSHQQNQARFQALVKLLERRGIIKYR